MHKFLVGSAILAIAASASPAVSMAATPHRSSMTCQEFLSLDEVTQPKVIYWAEGLNHKGKPEDAVVDIARTDQLVPVVIEQCKAAPHASFWQKLQTSWRKFEAKVRKDL